MKEKGFSPKPDETETILPPSDFGGDFLVAWLHRRKKNPESTDDEDDDEESEKPKSRFSRLFGKLFPRIAAKETIKPAERAENPLGELLTSSESKGAQQRIIQEQETVTYHPEDSKVPTEELSPKLQEQPNPIVRKNEVVAHLRDPYERLTSKVEDPSIGAARNIEANNTRESESSVFERRTEMPSLRSERVIERRVTEPLAVLEYFLRRRAVKNVERQVKKESANLEKKLRQSNESNERLQGLAKKSQEQLQELRTKRQTVEKPLIEKAEQIRTERVIEQPAPYRMERATKAEQIKPKIEASEYEAKEVPVQPERVLEQVLHAAEKNSPIEKLYERRHETKDEPTKIKGTIGDGAVPIGAVISDTMQQVGFNKQAHKHLSDNAQNSGRSHHNKLYKQAAVNGFWTALVLIAAIIAIALMQN